MPKHIRLLLVVADGEHVRYVRPAPDNALHSEVATESIKAHKRASDLGTDRPGAAFHSDSSAHHALLPRHNVHRLALEEFAHSIARELREAVDGFDELVMIAPPHTLSAIRGALDGATAAKIIGTLAKDLVKTPDDALWPHVREWVRPVHRA